MSEYVDAHCHLDLFGEHKTLLDECERNKINVLTMTNAPCVWAKNQELARSYEYIRVALGFHPQIAEERKAEIAMFEQYIAQTRFVGEVGLDGSREFVKSLNVQEKIFTSILRLCAKYDNKILSVHSRNTVPRVLMLLKECYPINSGKVILHWYSGSIENAISAVDYGCYFSVNERMLQTRNGELIVKNIPREKILTETDGPFLKVADRSVTPMQINRCVSILSKIWDTDTLTAKQTVFKNFNELMK